MRILQLIDSLEIGGAEKMAVNFANALNETIEFSGIAVTRKEGKLFESIANKQHYIFLNKKSATDRKAIIALKSYCKKNQITHVHAHGTSFFTAFLLKLMHPKIKIIWHDHSGARSNQAKKQHLTLSVASFLFHGIIAVNHDLQKWALKNLHCKNVIYLPNFTIPNRNEQSATILKGKSGFRILSLANLRHPKNHHLLIEVARKIKEHFRDWTFHLVGKDENDAYAESIKKLITEYKLEETVYLYGQRDDTSAIIQQATICVLTSSSEGLPVALLEYGAFKKPVIATNVGQIGLLIEDGKSGFLVVNSDLEGFYKSLTELIENPALITKFGQALFKTVSENHSQEAVIENYLNWLKKNG